MSIPTSNMPVSELRVLLVEDSVFHQRIATRLLANRGLTTTVANNGQEAVEAVGDCQFDLILMDIEMPVLDGCEATRIIREEESKRQSHVPIVALTSVDERDRLLSAGMDAYIRKPLTAQALDDILGEFAGASPTC